MYLKSTLEELLDAVMYAGGEIEPHRLTPEQLDALPLAPQLARITCESCRVELIAHRKRRFCSGCAKARARFEPARRAKPRNGRPG